LAVGGVFVAFGRVAAPGSVVYQHHDVEVGILQGKIVGFRVIFSGIGGIVVDTRLDEFVNVGQAPGVLFEHIIGAIAGFEDEAVMQ